jgi:hypothetical protein
MECKSFARVVYAEKHAPRPNGIRTRVTAVKGRYCLCISASRETTYGYRYSLLRQKLRKTHVSTGRPVLDLMDARFGARGFNVE